ncbi:MAG: Photosynthesis system assembly factor, partial [Verrucomicrobiota bacterium]
SIARQSNVGTPLALVAGNEGSTGIILRETDPGKFSEIQLPSTNLRSITTNTGDLTALAIADAGKLFRSTDGGTTFAQVGIGTSGNLLAADISTATGSAGARTAVIGASGGTIFRSANSGASWTAASISAPGFILGDIVSVAIEGTRGLAVDSKGVLLTTSNSGATWTAGEQGFTRSRINTISRSGSDFWALTENGEIHYRIPEGGLLAPPITLLDDLLSLGAIPTTSPGPHLRSTGITNVGNTTLNLTFTPSGSNVTVTPSSASVAPGQTVGVRLGLTTTATPGFASGSISITAAGFAKNLTLSIAGTVQARTWTVGNRFTTSNLIDVETRSEQIRHALSSTHFYQTLNRGSTWTERALPNTLARAMFFTSSTTGLVVGGTSSRGFILRTTDSGVSWTTVQSETRTTAFPGRAVTDVHLRTTNVGYAVTSSGSTSGFPPTNFRGILLRTTDAGVTWTSIAGPSADASFSGTSVHAVSDTSVFVASGSTLWNYNFTTNTWSSVRNFGSFINRVRFAPDNLTGWVVGINMLFAVTTTGGATSGSWGGFLELFPSSGNFDDLCFDVAGQARTIRNSTNAMEVWQQGPTGNDIWSRDTFSYAFESTTPRGRAIDMSSTIQGTIVGDGGVVWIYNPTPAVAADRALVTAPVLDFGVRRENTDPLLQNLTVLNPTNTTVRINDIIVENLGAEESFTAALGSVILGAGASTTIPVTFSGLAPGSHEALITVISDSPGGIHTRTRLTATVQAEPAGLVVRTSPPTLSLTVGGTTSTATASRVIRDGTAISGELNVGQALALTAQATQTTGGVSYKFSNWTGGAGGTGTTFNHTVGNSSRFAEAVYRPFFPVTTVTIPELASPTGGTGPNTRPSSGPWVRLTGAKLIVPNLRDFAVSGEMFLSGEAIRATLASTAFSVPQNSSAPVLEVGSGSWVLDWAKGGPFRFTSSSPSLKVLNSDLLPSATASLNFESNGNFGMNFSLPDGFQDVTGMLEVAPNGATPASIGFSFAGTARFNLNGRLRALSNGQGGWLVDQAVSISNSLQIFPQTLSLATEANSSTYINLGAFTITNGSVALTRDDNTGVISLGLNSLNLNGPLGTLTGLSAAASAN